MIYIHYIKESFQDDFQPIRTYIINNEVWFVGKDIASNLGYVNPSKAVIMHVEEEEKITTVLPYSHKDKPNNIKNNKNIKGKITLINESGLYSLIFMSKLESANKFRRWIIKEVLPAIKNNGMYILNQENLTDDELLEKALVLSNKIILERNIDKNN